MPLSRPPGNARRLVIGPGPKHGCRHAGTDFETFYVLDGDRVLRKSQAILHLNSYLAWPWRVGLILALIPRMYLDRLYDLIARNRYSLMGVRDSCRVPTSDERERFLT